MDEAQYQDLRRLVSYTLIGVFVVFMVAFGLGTRMDRLRAAFIHFATCPKCRSGETHIRAEAGGAYG